MYSTTQEQFENVKNFLEDTGAEESSLWTAPDGLQVAYYIATERFNNEIAPEGEPPLYGVNILWSHDNEYRIVIQPDVPESLRDLWAWGEVLDYFLPEEYRTRRRTDKAPWCPDAERYMQDLLRESDWALLQNYRPIRAKFWQSMARFAEANLEPDGEFKLIDVSMFSECVALCID